jgi:hypothetical protein
VLGDDAPDPAYFEVISVDEEIIPTDPGIGDESTDLVDETGG